MARTYSPKSVLRQLPLPLLRDFFSQQHVPTGTEWDALVENDTNALHLAWVNLPPADRARVEHMLRQVHELASEVGTQLLVREADARGHDIAACVGELEGHHARALWVLLNHPLAFHTARQLLAAQSPVGRFWNLTTDFDGRPARTDPASLQAFKSAVALLYREQGRGHRCTVEHYERDECVYLFAYVDDYVETHTSHDDRGTLRRTPLRPTFEVVFVYTRSAGTLDMYAKGDRRWRATLRDTFCEHILGCAVPAVEQGRRNYELNGLIDRTFPLSVDPPGGIMFADIKRMRVFHFRNSARRVTLEADPKRHRDVYDMLDEHFPADRFPRDELCVNQVTFAIRYVADGEDRERPLTFDVSFPDACNLKSLSPDQRAVGERCLREWGILCEPGDRDTDDGSDERDTGGPVDPSRAA